MMKKFLLTISLTAGMFVSVNYVVAAPDYSLDKTASTIGYTDKQKDIEPIVATVVKGFLAMTALFFFGLMAYAGLRWMTARGQEELIEQSRHAIQAAIIGLIVIVASWGVTNFILGAFGSPYTPPPSPVASPPGGAKASVSGCCEIMTNNVLTDCKENTTEQGCYTVNQGAQWIKGSCLNVNVCRQQAQVICFPTGGRLCEGVDQAVCVAGGCVWKYGQCIGPTDTTNCGQTTDKNICTLDPACGWVPAGTPP